MAEIKNMESRDTKLLSRKHEESPSARDTGLKPGTARRISLVALLALGAFIAFAVVSRHAGTPEQGAADRAEANLARQSAPMSSSHHAASGHAGHQAESATEHPVTPDTVEREWGVRITRLTLIAASGLVDLRYQVTDPEKASKVLDPEQSVYLLDEGNGKSVTTAQFPKLGNLRSQDGEPEAGREYFMGFSNPDGMFEAGDHVTLAVGSHRLEHVPVQ